MNYGIGNVKAKSSGGGGGGIPVITLEASQMISQTQIQFTEEQFNTIANNGAFYLDLLGSQQLLMTCVNASNLADIQCYNISQTGSGLQLATIDLNKTTYIGVLGVSPYPQAKQLYQHNVTMQYSYYIIHFEIINDSNTSITSVSEIKDYLFNNNFKFDYNAKACSGFMNNGSNVGIIYGIHRLTASGYIKADYLKNGTPTTDDIADPTTISDNVIAL